MWLSRKNEVLKIEYKFKKGVIRKRFDPLLMEQDAFLFQENILLYAARFLNLQEDFISSLFIK